MNLPDEYKIKNYLRSKYIEMQTSNMLLKEVRFNSVRNALVELQIISETKMEKWEEEFKKEALKCLKTGKAK